MQDFTTVFLFLNDGSEVFSGIFNRMLIGVLLIGIAFFQFSKAKEERRLIPSGILFFLFGAGWLAIHGIICWGDYQTYSRLKQVYENKQYKVTEGRAVFENIQAKGGRGSKEIVDVGSVKFTIDYFVNTVGYKQILERGGVLRENAYARIYYYDDPPDPSGAVGGSSGWGRTILRIDVKNEPQT